MSHQSLASDAPAVQIAKSIEFPNEMGARQGCVYDALQTIPHKVDDDVENAKAMTVVKRILILESGELEKPDARGRLLWAWPDHLAATRKDQTRHKYAANACNIRGTPH